MDKQITFLTTEEAARRLGITRQGLSYLVANGKIKIADNVKSSHKFFKESDIYDYIAERDREDFNIFLP